MRSSTPSFLARCATRVFGVGLVTVLAALPVSAQTGQVVGTVRDAGSLQPLEAAQVYVAGTGVGTLTQANGRYVLLNVPVGEITLVAELVGRRSSTQTVTVTEGEAVVADFTLEQTAIALDQIVVTGAGVATERRKLGNSIATIDPTSLENAPVNDFSQLLAGREPGVVALPSSGATGEGARIRIRGSSSLSQLNEPIIYVDGIRVDRSAVGVGAGGQGNPSRLDDIPPDAIERVEILKGAAAATLYGTEASNGVIQIFTKKGRAGAPRFSVQTEFTGVTVPSGRMDPLADFARDADDVAQIQQRFGVSVQPYEPFEQDLLPTLFSTGFAQSYSASVQGGSEGFQYFVSGRYQNEDGPYDAPKNFDAAPGLDPSNDINERFQATTNFTLIPSGKFRIGVSALYAQTNQETPDNSNNIYGVFSSALMSQLRLAEDGNYFGQPAFATLRENMYQINQANSTHVAGSVTAGFTPTDDFRLDGTFGFDFTSDDVVNFRPYRWNVDDYSGSTPDGNRQATERRSRDLTADLKGTWTSRFGEFENVLLFGGQGFVRQSESAGGGGQDFPGPGLEVVSAIDNQYAFESWLRNAQIGGYLQSQLGWRDWVFFTVGNRWDANSAFGEDFETASYPKASISLVPSQGLGWENETFSTFRVRAALGQSGLQPGAFDKFTTYSPLPSSEGPGVQPSNLGNDALKPEVSTEWEIGAELGLFNDRASVEVTYWDRTVADALVARQFPVTGGFTSTQLDNIGEMVASGVEVAIRGSAIQSSNFSLNVFANTAYLKEEITDLGGAPPLKTGGSYPRYTNYLVEGYAPGAFFGAEVADVDIPLNLDGSCVEPTRDAALAYFSEPRDPSSFKPLAIGNSDFGTPNGALSSNNCGEGLLLTNLGKPAPDFQGSFGFDANIGAAWTLNTLFEYKAGNYYVQDLSGMFRRAHPLIGRNTPDAARLNAIMQNPASTAEQRLDAAVEWARTVEGLSPMSGLNGVNPADFVKLREISLSYRVPSSFVEQWGLGTATLTLGARNLATWVNGAYPGMDPEGNVLGRCNGGLDCNFLDSTEGWGVPIPRRITFSTRVTF